MPHPSVTPLRALALALLYLCVSTLSVTAWAKSERYTFLISDTHFGVGRDSKGVWHAYEDARWAGDLENFLQHVEAVGGGKADLIINGDVFELWQSTTVPCQYPNKDAGCSDADALLRLKNALSAHTAEVDALKAFSQRKENKLVFVVGNHDVALLLPSVKAELLNAFSCAGCNFAFASSGVWSSDDGKVRAEHGHQIGEDLNAFDGWPTPILTVGSKQHVRRPWGEQFVQDFYNQFEAKYPVIDNITDEFKAMRLGLGAEGVKGSGRGALEFLKFMALRESWAQINQFMGGDGKPTSAWDVDVERAKGSLFLKQSFSTGDVAQDLLKGVGGAETDAFVRDKDRLTDAQIREICDARASRNASDPSIARCSSPMGSVVNSALKDRVKKFRKHLNALAKTPRVLVYSHTHSAERFSISAPDVEVLNTGAWQRLISPSKLESRAQSVGKKPEELLAQLRPEDLEACYTFVSIAPYPGNAPIAELRSWRVNAEHPQGQSSLALCN